MAKVKPSGSSGSPKIRPATTPEARENQMIDYAVSLAEKQLIEGTASSQIITHYLKLAADKKREELELKILEKQAELYDAKTKQLRNQEEFGVLYERAIAAMRTYGGHGGEEDESDDEPEDY